MIDRIYCKKARLFEESFSNICWNGLVVAVIFFVTGLTGLEAMQEGDWAPKPVDKYRYRELWEESPFTTHVVEVEEVEEEEPGFIEDLELIGLYYEGTVPVISLRDTVRERTLMVRMGEEIEGLVVEAVENPANPQSTVVRLRQGSETGQLRHSAETLALTPTARPRPREQGERGEPQRGERGEPQRGERGEQSRSSREQQYRDRGGRESQQQQSAQRGQQESGAQSDNAPRRRTISPRGN